MPDDSGAVTAPPEDEPPAPPPASTPPPNTSNPAADPNAGLKTALDSERELRRDAEKKLKEIEEASELAKKTEVEQERTLREKAEKERDEARLGALRIKVGAASGLPAEIVDRLKGDDEAEMKKDAERIAKSIGQANGGLDGGARGTDDKPSDMNTILRKVGGSGQAERSSGLS